MKASRTTRSILITALGIGMACTLPTLAMAKVNGVMCANCHTMHASQQNDDGLAAGLGYDAWDATAQAGTPRGALLANSCVGCHTADGATRLNGNNAPAVIASTANIPADVLPGGFFEIGATENKQHSITGAGLLAGLEAPPGANADVRADAANISGGAGGNFVCAGTYGCHGDPAVADQGASISGIHHNDTATGFRGLYDISGVESTEYDVAKNGYSGVQALGDAGAANTISSLCAQCHGDFHDLTDPGVAVGDAWDGVGTAWIRHPTDFALTDANQLNDGYDDYVTATYDEEVPVGKTIAGYTLSSSTGATDYTTNWPAGTVGDPAIVICLSCHRAHGSPNPDLLRWDYETMIAGDGTVGTGCFRCHTSKDDGVI